MPLSLSPDVHACSDNGVVVLLDLRANRYFALPPAVMLETGVAIGGLPAGRSRLSHEGVELLRARRAIVEAQTIRPDVQEAPSVREPAALNDRPLISRVDVASFAVACALADRAVRSGTLHASVNAISRAKARACAGDAVDRASAFSRLRVWYPRARVCLFDSLALARFLAWSRCSFDLIFAVRSRPFAAHCWVEAGGRALNDFYDTHAAFTPILRI